MNKDLKKRAEMYKLQKYVDKLMADQSITLCYSKKRGMYERPGGSGYTDYMYFAGVFPKQDVCKWFLDSHGEISVIPVDIDKHNQYIMEKIEELRNNLIPTPKVEQCLHKCTSHHFTSSSRICDECGVILSSPENEQK